MDDEEAEFEVGRKPTRRQRSGIARLLRALVFLIAIGAVAAGGAAFLAKQVFERSGPLTETRVVSIQSGDSLSAIAAQFEKDGVIHSALLFRAAAKLQGVASAVQAGDYEIPAGASMREVLVMVTTGQAINYRITIAEGLTVAEALALVEQNEFLIGEITTVPSEGKIAPETYFIRRGEERQVVVDRMVAAQDKILAELWETRQEGLPLASPEEALILASIVEKETGVSGERAMVASVFINRIIKGMRLQTDPTVIYGITLGSGPLGRELTRADLQTETPYNTYVIDGLPPTPIANPGYEAIKATLQPAETDYFYFVADGTGGHAFGRTLDEHNANVRRWRQIQREQRANQ